MASTIVIMWAAGALAGYGIGLIVWFALQRELEPDPRFGSLLVLMGIGLLVVGIVKAVTT